MHRVYGWHAGVISHVRYMNMNIMCAQATMLQITMCIILCLYDVLEAFNYIYVCARKYSQ